MLVGCRFLCFFRRGIPQTGGHLGFRRVPRTVLGRGQGDECFSSSATVFGVKEAATTLSFDVLVIIFREIHVLI